MALSCLEIDKFCCSLFTATTTGSVPSPADGAESWWQTTGEYRLRGSAVPVFTQVCTQIQPDGSNQQTLIIYSWIKRNFNE